jgi:hypothetical protein
MQHPGGMGGLQRREHLKADPRHLPRRQGPVFPDHLAQGPRLDQLHHDPGPALLLHHVVHGDDVGVAEPGGRPGLAQGPLPQDITLVVRQLGRQEHLLDRHVAAEEFVAGLPDDPHAATAELVLQPVPSGQDPALHR